jgi:hypothetical protein
MDQHYHLISFFKTLLENDDAEIVNNIENALKREEKERQELHFLRHSELQYVVYNMASLKSKNKLNETLLNLEKLYYSSDTRKPLNELKMDLLEFHANRKLNIQDTLARGAVIQDEPAQIEEEQDLDANKLISINNVVYNSLKEACEKTKINKSTILWRVKSKNPKFKEYRYVSENAYVSENDDNAKYRKLPENCDLAKCA